MGVKRLLRAVRGEAIGRKNFQGDLFDRFQGLEPLFERAAGASILDVGMSEGHIAYEFARRGAALIHGVEKHRDKVRFARRLFRDVPVAHRFWRADLSRPDHPLKPGSELRASYDVVLLLGVYHHLRKQMPQARLDALLDALLERTGIWFGVRSDALPDFAPRIEARGFVLDYEAPKEKVGLLRVYRRADR
jgi:2-polyprenyl-3-methyl-5-hydroxy-6-metoxy-1,4-benzoquinol methylase